MWVLVTLALKLQLLNLINIGLDARVVWLRRLLFKPHSYPNDFYWGQQMLMGPTRANSMQVSIKQSDNCNRK